MAWFNPATWGPVDKAQALIGGLGRTTTGLQLGSNNSNIPRNSGSGFSLPVGSITNPSVNWYNGSVAPTVAGVSGAPNAQTTETTTANGTTYGMGTPVWTDPTGRGLSQGQYNGLMDTYNNQLGNFRQSATDWGNAYAPGYRNTVENYINKLRQGQESLNERGIQNELSLAQGRRSILDMVGQGIRSGGVALAGRNATAGSALDQIAKAYGQYGNQQLSNVGNQYALNDRDLGLEQSNFNADIPISVGSIKARSQSDIASTVQEARNNLANLQAWAASQSLPVQLDAAAEAQRIQDEISALVGGFNTQLDTGIAGVQPLSIDARKQKAASLAQQGTAAANPFDFSTDMPIGFQDTGPAPGGLPIFTIPRKKNR